MNAGWIPPQFVGRQVTDGPEPKHAQLREILDEICSTALKPGDMLPGERVLEEAFNVSRITVRRAIGDLVNCGKLRRTRGKGTFVAAGVLITHLNLASFSEEMSAQHMKATARLITAEKNVPPNKQIIHWFNSCGSSISTPAPTQERAEEPDKKQKKEAVHITRLRLGDGQPYSIDDGWYNGTLVPDLLDQNLTTSLYKTLNKVYGLPITTAEQTVTAVAADPHTAHLLDVPAGYPLLKIERQAFSGAKPVEWCVSLYRTDRYQLATTVTRKIGTTEYQLPAPHGMIETS